jgi:VIT1/CCC1 family predicted Fe2+/Mn2+ transporter
MRSRRTFSHRHHERHRSDRSGWLRAAVLGANDGIVSTASLLIGIAASHASQVSLAITGVAALVAGAMSMAAGEYVSVSSQTDTENADLDRERNELDMDIEAERRELAAIYVGRGLKPALAQEVAHQLMEHDALAAHARDELGLSATLQARPVQAAMASALAFSAGAFLPLITVLLVNQEQILPVMAVTSLLFLAALGAIAARTGGASIAKGTARVTFWGALAMALTAAAGAFFGAS